ncbi:hypothetical protein BJ165DRAFT_105484 [Panaeolus papilionaceus]|nr:hypothetical protein BJ165DRAFT_105484 [Panaeolus papilionaceus]
MSSSPTKATPKEIKRVPMACKNCRNRKLKVLGAGTCERCHEQQIQCIYEPIQKQHDPPSPPHFIQPIISVPHPHRTQTSPPVSPASPEQPYPSSHYPSPNLPSTTWNQPARGGFPGGQVPHEQQPQYPTYHPGVYPQPNHDVYPQNLPQHPPTTQYQPPASQHQQHPQQTPIHNGPIMSYPGHINPGQQIPMTGQPPYMTYPLHEGNSTQPVMINPMAGGTYVNPTGVHDPHTFVNTMPSGVPAYPNAPILHQPNPGYHDSSLAQWQQYHATGGSGNDRNDG